MAYRDLRDWIDTLEKKQELARVGAKVDPNLELGGIAQEVVNRKGPALLFENVKGHEKTLCKRYFTGSLGSYSRIALMMGLPKETAPGELIRVFKERARQLVKPKLVKAGPVKQNVLTGDRVDLNQFIAPKWHDRDGGRVIGTCHGVVVRDPETGWENIGLYRLQLHDRNHTGITIIHGQHIWQIWRKYRNLNRKTMPVAVVWGWDPVLPFITCSNTPPQVCEYDVMGAVRGEPVPLVKCETVDLEVPATAEVVMEGEISLDFDSFRIEGPFGEQRGYYASEKSRKPVVTINCITCRDEPIMQGVWEGAPINESDLMTTINFSGFYWDFLDKQMPGITGVHLHAGGTLIIQIDNSYICQPQQVAYAVWGTRESAIYGKNIIVVDKDIDIFDLDQVLWAFQTRVDPHRDILMVPGSVSVTDPVIHPDARIGVPGQTIIKTTRLLIDATKYLGHPRTEGWFGEKYAPIATTDEKTRSLVQKRWPQYGIP